MDASLGAHRYAITAALDLLFTPYGLVRCRFCDRTQRMDELALFKAV